MKRKITLKSLWGNLKANNLSLPPNPRPVNNNSDIQINIIQLAKLISLNRKLITYAVLLFMALTTLIVFLIPNKYESTASVLPSGKIDTFSMLQDIAASAGYGYNADENSSALFPTILTSNQIRDAVLQKEYIIDHNSQDMRIRPDDYFGTDNPDRLREKLGGITSINMDKKTGVIRIAVETRYPEFSQAILGQYLAELDSFNLYKRRSSAKENARYLEKELALREIELKAAEDSLEAYQMVNQSWDASTNAEILKALTQFQRDIEIKSKTYVFLREQYEIARLDARKDVPVVRVLDFPSLPTLKSGPHRVRTILLSGFAAFVLASLVIIAIDAFGRTAPAEYRTSMPVINRTKKILSGATADSADK